MAMERVTETARHSTYGTMVGWNALPSIATSASGEQFSTFTQSVARSEGGLQRDASRDRGNSNLVDPRLNQLMLRQMVDAMLPKAGTSKVNAGCAEDMWRSMLVDILSQKTAAAITPGDGRGATRATGNGLVHREVR